MSKASIYTPLRVLYDHAHRAPTVAEYQELVETHDAVAALIQDPDDD